MKHTILLVSQVYVPDPASLGQHMADVAAELVHRGHRVVVLTSARGYEEPSVRYPAREVRDGVEIRRLPLASFGKSSIPLRLAGAIAFLAQVVVRGILLRGLGRGRVLVSTSPPLAGLAGALVAGIRGAKLTYWVMDINPEQAVALGKAREGGLAARAFDAMNAFVLSRADEVVTLDRFMAATLQRKAPIEESLVVSPPWPHEEHVGPPVPHDENPFRARHDLEGKLVLMYSGNHSIASPLTTILAAARQLEEDERALFVFVGGGLGKREVDEAVARGAPNVRSLPYQPLENLRHSLGAADVHLVAMGERMVGIIHPCKAYGALAAGRPLLYVGPAPSHVSELVDEHRVGWRAASGDVEGTVAAVRGILATSRAELEAMGARGRELVEASLGKRILCGRVADVVERAPRPRAAGEARERRGAPARS